MCAHNEPYDADCLLCSRLCPAVSNPDTTEAEEPSAKKQRAARSSAKSSNEVHARQHGRFGAWLEHARSRLAACQHSRHALWRV
jgi:hypothetical protein